MRKRAALNDADREQFKQIADHYPAWVQELMIDEQAARRLVEWGLVKVVVANHYVLTDAGTVAARELGYLVPF